MSIYISKRSALHLTGLALALAAGLLLLTQTAYFERAVAGHTSAPQQPRTREMGRHRPTPGTPLEAGEQLAQVSVTLFPEGFDPDELSVPAGAVMLDVTKRVGLLGVELELRTEGRGEVVGRVNMGEDVLNHSEVLRLRPGRYTLTAAGHPEWSCRVVVRSSRS